LRYFKLATHQAEGRRFNCVPECEPAIQHRRDIWGNNSSKNAGMVTTVSIRQGDDFNHPFRLGNRNTAGFVASLARENTVRN
jgi:hypothetical protein